MEPTELDMLRALEPIDIDWAIDEEDEQETASIQRTPGAQSLAAWVIIQAARDAMTDRAPSSKVSKSAVTDAVRYFRDRDYEGHAQMTGLSMIVLECMRIQVLARHGVVDADA